MENSIVSIFYNFNSSFPVRKDVSKEDLDDALASLEAATESLPDALSIDAADGATTVTIEVHNFTGDRLATRIDEAWIELVKRCADFSDGPVEATSGGGDYEDGPIEWLIGPKIAVLRRRLGETHVRIAELQDKARRLRSKLTRATAARKRRRRDVVIAEYP